MISLLRHSDIILTFWHQSDIILTSFSEQMIGPIIIVMENSRLKNYYKFWEHHIFEKYNPYL